MCDQREAAPVNEPNELVEEEKVNPPTGSGANYNWSTSDRDDSSWETVGNGKVDPPSDTSHTYSLSQNSSFSTDTTRNQVEYLELYKTEAPKPLTSSPKQDKPISITTLASQRVLHSESSLGYVKASTQSVPSKQMEHGLQEKSSNISGKKENLQNSLNDKKEKNLMVSSKGVLLGENTVIPNMLVDEAVIVPHALDFPDISHALQESKSLKNPEVLALGKDTTDSLKPSAPLDATNAVKKSTLKSLPSNVSGKSSTSKVSFIDKNKNAVSKLRSNASIRSNTDNAGRRESKESTNPIIKKDSKQPVNKVSDEKSLSVLSKKSNSNVSSTSIKKPIIRQAASLPKKTVSKERQVADAKSRIITKPSVAFKTTPTSSTASVSSQNRVIQPVASKKSALKSASVSFGASNPSAKSPLKKVSLPKDLNAATDKNLALVTSYESIEGSPSGQSTSLRRTEETVDVTEKESLKLQAKEINLKLDEEFVTSDKIFDEYLSALNVQNVNIDETGIMKVIVEENEKVADEKEEPAVEEVKEELILKESTQEWPSVKAPEKEGTKKVNVIPHKPLEKDKVEEKSTPGKISLRVTDRSSSREFSNTSTKIDASKRERSTSKESQSSFGESKQQISGRSSSRDSSVLAKKQESMSTRNISKNPQKPPAKGQTFGRGSSKESQKAPSRQNIRSSSKDSEKVKTLQDSTKKQSTQPTSGRSSSRESKSPTRNESKQHMSGRSSSRDSENTLIRKTMKQQTSGRSPSNDFEKSPSSKQSMQKTSRRSSSRDFKSPIRNQSKLQTSGRNSSKEPEKSLTKDHSKQQTPGRKSSKDSEKSLKEKQSKEPTSRRSNSVGSEKTLTRNQSKQLTSGRSTSRDSQKSATGLESKHETMVWSTSKSKERSTSNRSISSGRSDSIEQNEKQGLSKPNVKDLGKYGALGKADDIDYAYNVKRRSADENLKAREALQTMSRREFRRLHDIAQEAGGIYEEIMSGSERSSSAESSRRKGSKSPYRRSKDNRHVSRIENRESQSPASKARTLNSGGKENSLTSTTKAKESVRPSSLDRDASKIQSKEAHDTRRNRSTERNDVYSNMPQGFASKNAVASFQRRSSSPEREEQLKFERVSGTNVAGSSSPRRNSASRESSVNRSLKTEDSWKASLETKRKEVLAIAREKYRGLLWSKESVHHSE